MEISLNKEGVEGIRKLIGKLDTLNMNLEIAGEEAVDELVFKGATRASFLNSATPQTGTERSTIVADTNRTNKGYEGIISLTGPNAVYDEFGVGEEGAKDPHPIKSNFNLNDYNSGPFVSTHINKNGTHYWFYGPMRGRPYFDAKSGYTEGVPSGKQMFNTSKFVRELESDVLKSKINNATKFIK